MSAASKRARPVSVASVVVTRRAEAELRAIWRYVAAENPDAADRVLLAIDDRIGLLGDFPDLGVSSEG